MSFVSVKKGKVAEAHTIDRLSGSFLGNGDLLVKLDLSSVNTNIGIRDTRMQKHLFQIGAYPSATVSAKVGKIPNGVSHVKGAIAIKLARYG